MTVNRTVLIFKVIFVMSVLNFSFWSYIKDWTGVGVWYCGNALAYVGYIYVIYEFSRIFYKTNKKYSDLLTWAEVAIGAAISNLADELFFNPTELGVNEYIGFALVILIAAYNDFKRKKQNRNGGGEDYRGRKEDR